MENQKLVKELTGGMSPGAKNQKRTAQSKYLMTSNRFGLNAKVAKQDLVKDSKGRKPDFIKANKARI